MPQAGTAKNLLSKWQNLDSSLSSSNQRKGPRPITPPPAEELDRAKSLNEQEQNDSSVKAPQYNDELTMLKGAARNNLAK